MERWLVKTYLSPLKIILVIAASTFLMETCLMLLLHYIYPVHLWYHDLIDSFIFLVLLIPVFYLFIFRPLIHHIDQYRKLSGELAGERDLVKNYLDTAGAVILVLDLEGRVTLVNRQGAEMLGCQEEEMIGKDFFDNFVPGGSREVFRRNFERVAVEGLIPLESFESRAACSGGEKTMLWRNTLLKDNDGRPKAVLFSGIDITERKLMEEALKERVDELDRFRRATVARELRMKELRDRLKEFEDVAGKVRSF